MELKWIGSTHTGVDMETSPVPARIVWEKNYNDGSGVEYGVRLDTTKINNADGGPVVSFEHVGLVEFPINELDWLIACLMRIKAEVRPNAAGERPETRSEVAGTHDPIVRLWVVVEEDRGMGATAYSCHASEEDANTHCSGHKFADPVDVPWSVLESLKPNAKAHFSKVSDSERRIK